MHLSGMSETAVAPPIPLLWTTCVCGLRVAVVDDAMGRWRRLGRRRGHCRGCSREGVSATVAMDEMPQEKMPRGPGKDHRRSRNHWSVSGATAVNNDAGLLWDCSCG